MPRLVLAAFALFLLIPCGRAEPPKAESLKDFVLKNKTHHAVGLYLIAWGIFTSYMFIASLRTTGAIALVFVLLAVTYFLLGIGNANGSDSLVKAGGWVGLATAIAAWYASFAAVTNATFGRIVLPVIPLKR